jgi:CRISPR type III-A-associated RAMP protein Csm4
MGIEAHSHPDYTLSSAFPFVGFNKAYSYFLPRIVLPEIEYDEAASTPRKTLKKLRWLNVADFERTIAGQGLPGFQELGPRISGQYLFTEGEGNPEPPFKSEVQQRVTVPRLSDEDAVPYYIEKLFFREDCGLYLLADCDEEAANWLEKVLGLLGLSGIGTDRNVGCGHFSLERDQIDLRLPDDADALANLSLYLPENKAQLNGLMEGNGLKMSRIVERGGWISTAPYQSLRKNSICMIVEGGVFPVRHEKPKSMGRTADLNPKNVNVSHPILRCGRSLFIPLKTTRT